MSEFFITFKLFIISGQIELGLIFIFLLELTIDPKTVFPALGNEQRKYFFHVK